MATGLFIVGLAIRAPFRSQYAYHWDSAQFALAMGEYDLRIGQPHAPGFYLYIVLGRLVNQLVGEPHAALVWLSVIAGAWLAAIGYLLATSMFGRRCGAGTGLILLTSPLCWFQSEIALTTIVDSALVVSFAFVCWLAIRKGVTWTRTIMVAALLAAVAGVRQQSAPVLIPLFVYVFWGWARPRGWKLLGATALVIGLCLGWFLPTVKSAGGLAPYLELLRLKSRFDAAKTVWGAGGMSAVMRNASLMAIVCSVGLLVAGIASAMEFVHWVFFEGPASKSAVYRRYKTQLCVLALWIAPPMVFWTLMYVTMPGYVLNFFPAFAILAGLGLVGFSERVAASPEGKRSWALSCLLAIVVATNVVVFAAPVNWTKYLLMDLPLTGREIREHDANLATCFRTIRQNWPSRNVVVCHCRESFYWGFRQFEYHLPEYQNVLLTSDPSLPGVRGTQKWIGYGHRTTFQNDIRIPEGHQILLVVPPDESVDVFKSHFDTQKAVLITDSALRMYLLQP